MTKFLSGILKKADASVASQEALAPAAQSIMENAILWRQVYAEASTLTHPDPDCQFLAPRAAVLATELHTLIQLLKKFYVDGRLPLLVAQQEIDAALAKSVTGGD